ncbi:MAG: AraC family transcriptional regulator [Gammaproteobacteria bacterium]|nr:AraC family transcriptional regulator [Gammaproteobacteria bacterium]
MIEQAFIARGLDILDFDLERVAVPQRRTVWRQWSAETFGRRIQVTGCPDGDISGFIRGVRLGIGRLLHICTAGREVICADLPRGTPVLTLVLQLNGLSCFEQGARRGELRAGDLCVLDSQIPFRQQVSLGSEMMLLQTERPAAAARHAALLASTGSVCQAGAPAAYLVRGAIESAMPTAPQLPVHRRDELCHALFDLATLLFDERGSGAQLLGRHPQLLAEIDAQLGDSALDATCLASRVGVSRRRLDQIFVRELGCAVAAYIRRRRLERAREMLADPRFDGCSITDIALTVGFEDMSHFTRAFKGLHGVLPSASRRRRGAGRDQ